MSPRAGTRSAWERWSWAVAGIWLIFLAYPFIEAFQAEVSTPARVLTLAALTTFGVVYLLGFGWWQDHGLVVLGALCLLALATVPVIGIEAVGMTPFIGAYSALMVDDPWWPWTTAVASLLPLASLLGGDFPMFFFLLVWPIIAACVIGRVLTRMEIRAGETHRELALVAERERVARDVHDVLGHSLTALSVKAELAARLIDVDPARARVELESIQETARQALAEVRSTVGGLRAGNLAAEVEAAPRVLADAGVTTEVVGSVDETDPRHRALLAWVLREAVTNVVRHADADHVRIELRSDGLVVEDDGLGLSGPEGNGLRGMRERVRDAGGDLTVEAASPGVLLQVVLP